VYRIVEGPQIALAGIGQVLPFYFGVLQKQPCIPLRTGAQAALRESITAGSPADGGVLKLDSLEQLRRFPDAGTGQVDGERITWTGRNFADPSLTGLDRGAEATTPADHSLGTPFFEVVAEHVYVIGQNPGNHVLSSVDAVYLNGILKEAATPPVHTITLENTTILQDQTTGDPISCATVSFDMSTITAAQSQYLVPSTFAALQQWLLNWSKPRGGGSAAGPPPNPLQAEGVAFLLPPKPKLVPVPQLGTVDVDLHGLLDDDSGTISGAANSLLTRPAHITKCLLREAGGQGSATFDSTWPAVALRQAAFNMAWALRFLPMTDQQFFTHVALQSRTYVTQSATDTWRAVFREFHAASDTLEPDRRIAWSMGWTPRQDVQTGLTVSYAEGELQKEIILRSSAAEARSETRTSTVQYPWIVREGLARQEGQSLLDLIDHQRREGQARMGWHALPILKTDTVSVDHPMLDAYGGTLLGWWVKGVRVNPDATLDIDLEEADNAKSSPVEIQAAVTLALRRRRLARLEIVEVQAAEADETQRRDAQRRRLRVFVPPEPGEPGEFFGARYYGARYYGAGYFR
jgi:hypothetical protein